MNSAADARIALLELALAALKRQFRDLQSRAGKAEQLNPTTPGGGDPGTSGGGADIFQAKTTGSLIASGAFPSTPGTRTEDVYTLDASPALHASGATIYYHSTTSLPSGSILLVKSNADGSYSGVGVICNA